MGDILHSVLNSDIVLKAIETGVVALIALLSKLAWEQILKTKNTVAISVATYAVHWVEDKYGPDTQLGQTKLFEATNFVSKELHMDREKAEKLVRAAYTAIFTQPVGNAPALSSTKP